MIQLPTRLRSPKIKLGYAERIVHTFGSRRKKGLFGNRYGELHITNQRVAFVRALTHAHATSRQISPYGVKPMLAFDNSSITAIEIGTPTRRGVIVQIEIHDGRRIERFVIDERDADTVVEWFRARAVAA